MAVDASTTMRVGGMVGAIELLLDGEVVELVKHVVGAVRQVTELVQKHPQRRAPGLPVTGGRALSSVPFTASSSSLSSRMLGASPVVAAHASSTPSLTGASALPTTHRAALMAVASMPPWPQDCCSAAPPPRRQSSRLLARPSSVPVSRRATHRLIRQLDLVGQEEAIGDEAVEKYERMYQRPLPRKTMAAERCHPYSQRRSDGGICCSRSLSGSRGG